MKLQNYFRLKHHHRKKTINHMEDVILCSQCMRQLKAIEKQEKEIVSTTPHSKVTIPHIDILNSFCIECAFNAML